MSKKEKICGIYKIISPTGRVYIGQSVNIINRFNDYKNVRKRIKGQVLLYNSIIKYGWESHTFEIIEECLEEDLNCRERYWQDFYDVLNGGLNLRLTECGELKYRHSEDVKSKISNSMRGKHSGSKNPMFGKKPWQGRKHSEYTKNKLSKIKKKEVVNTDNNIIYESYKEVARILNIGESCMRARLNGQNINKTPYQYLEDFLKDNPDFDQSLFTYYS